MNKDQQKQLLQIARKTLETEFNHTKYDVDETSGELNKPAATFVTLTKNSQLRGCIGTLEAFEPLVDNIQRNVLSAAFNDFRFPPLSKSEFDQINIEISILSESKEIKYNDVQSLLSQITPNIDGIVLEKSNRSATFLPQVWQDLPNKNDFLEALCQKAGLPKDRWQSPGVLIKKYQVEKFSE